MGAVNWTYVFTIILPIVFMVLLVVSFLAMWIYDICYWICHAIRKWVWERRLHN